MGGFRRQLRLLASVWIACQLTAIATPATFLASALIESCLCPATGDGAACPMHHDAGEGSPSPSDCTMKSAASSAPAGPAVLLFTLGVAVLPSQWLPKPSFAPTPVTLDASLTLGRTELPESPPPRA